MIHFSLGNILSILEIQLLNQRYIQQSGMQFGSSFLGPIYNSWDPWDHDKVNGHPWGLYVMKLIQNNLDYPHVSSAV